VPTIDVQVHVYERNHAGRPWAAVLHGPSEVTGDQMVAAMDEVGVDGAILALHPVALRRALRARGAQQASRPLRASLHALALW
jgi:predicted TIM-barrel fold metal-dependent hydrolase